MDSGYDEQLGDEQYDSDAPYGRNPAGKPYTLPLEERMRRGATLAAARAAKKGQGKKVSGLTPPPLAAANMPAGQVGKTTAERRTALLNWMNLPIGILAGVGKVYEPAMLDAMTLTVHRPALANGVALAADKNEVLAKWVDKLTASSPYVPAAIAAVALVAQVAVNHGLMQPNKQLGSVSVDDMKDQFYQSLGVERPETDPRRREPSPMVPDYPPSDLADAAA